MNALSARNLHPKYAADARKATLSIVLESAKRTIGKEGTRETANPCGIMNVRKMLNVREIDDSVSGRMAASETSLAVIGLGLRPPKKLF